MLINRRRSRALTAVFAALASSLMTLAVAPAAHATGSANIVVTEIAYGGLNGAGPDGEYVELTNTGQAAQDVSGWYYDTSASTAIATPSPTAGLSLATLADASGTNTVVAPGESIIITDLAPAEFRTEWNLKSSVKVISDGAFTLKKAGSVYVSNGTSVLDQVSYDLTNPGKGKSAWVSAANAADQQSAGGSTFSFNATSSGTSNGWTVSTAGDSEGSWTSAHGAVGSPAASTLGTSTPASVQRAADMVITELAYGGNAVYSGDTGDGEYVELTNVGEAAADLSGWYYDTSANTTLATPSPTAGLSLAALADGSGTNTVVAPGESVIITDLTPTDFRTEWGLKPSVKVINDSTFTLKKAGSVYLSNGTTVLDQVSYDMTTPGKGKSAWVSAANAAAQQTPAGSTFAFNGSTAPSNGWTVSSLNDSEGSWNSTGATASVGSPAASTLGTSTPTSVRAAGVSVSGGSAQTATVGMAFSYTGLSASGGTGTYTWTAPALAGTGLSIDPSTGAITGTPTSPGTINVTATATDGASVSGSASFTISVISGIDPNWASIVINEVTSDNSDNNELTDHLAPALLSALNTAPNAASDLVELYNKGDQAVDISGWKQIDSHAAGNATDFSGRVFDVNGNKITSIPAHGFGVFQSGQGLGSGGDAVKIYLPDGTLVDSVTFGPGQAGYDESLDPEAAGPSSTETYHALARCPDGAGAVNSNSDDATTSWYSVKDASFGASNDSACDTSTDPSAAVQYYNEQPPTGLPSTCSPSAPSGSDSIAVPNAVPWPSNAGVSTVDNACEFITPQDPIGNDMSGLVFSPDGSTLWGAQNKNHLWKLVKDPVTGKYLPATDNDWGNGKAITFTGTDPNASQPDDEGITLAANGDLVTTSERDNQNSKVSKDEVLEYDPNATGTTLAPVQQWDLTSEFVPSVISATGDDANLGFEGVTFVPDSFLTAHGFHDQHLNKTYDPADYPAHGGGLYFLGFEKNGHIYAYSLNADGTFQRVADIDTGIDGTSAIADLQFNAADQGIWAHCDNDCGVVESLLRIDANGNFTRVVSYNRPAGLPDDNLEGFAISPVAVNGQREVVWSDDGIYGEGNAWNADKTANVPSADWGHALYASSIPVDVAPQTQTLQPTPTISGTGKVGTALTANVGTWDAGVTTSYQWLNGATVLASNGPLALTPSLLGHTITLSVTGTKPDFATVTKTATKAVTAGVLTGAVPAITGAARVGTTLRAVPGAWGPGSVHVAYQWYAGGVRIVGATASTFALKPAQFGKAITVVVTGSEAGYATTTRTSKATARVVAGTITATVPKVRGIVRVGRVLTAVPGLWRAGSIQPVLHFQWLANGKVIKHATGRTLKLTAALRGKRIRVRVTATSPRYVAAARTSAATRAVTR